MFFSVQNFFLYLVFLCFFIFPALGAEKKQEKTESYDYPYNPHVPPEIWLALEPYFLPASHPIKERLDFLFNHHRVTLSPQKFEKGGFGKAKMRKPTNIVVGRNRGLKGYLFKVYLDSQPHVCEWDNWVRRIQGAKAIQQCIDKHGFCHFIVPKKWIYPLPADPSPPDDIRCHRKNFILVVEEMDILHGYENLKAYKTNIDQQHLSELYCILTDAGLLDSVYPDNIPFTKQGQIAFIDTEHYNHPKETIPYQKLTRYLSEEMGIYWQTLFNSNN